MYKNIKTRRWVAHTAVLLALLTALGGAAPAMAEEEVSSQDYQAQLDDINEELKDVKTQQDKVKQQLAAVSSEKKKMVSEQNEQEQQIELTKTEIELLEQKMDVQDQKIADKKREISEKETEIADNLDKYKKRMRAMYMAGESSTLSMVLGASDFTDLLMRTEAVRALAQRDTELLATLRLNREELQIAKEELDADLVELEADRSDMQARKAEHEKQLEDIKGQIQDISKEEAEYKANQAALDKRNAQLNSEMDKIYEALKPKLNEIEYVGGEFAWPVPGHYQITSSYGMRWGSDFHTGCDIAGGVAYGASIRAANDGEVVLAQNMASGYGKYVIVSHGGGISTLYAHMSAISVSVGDRVSAGTSEIGKIGMTGWATGPHLHFEVRINNKTTNPMGYLKG